MPKVHALLLSLAIISATAQQIVAQTPAQGTRAAATPAVVRDEARIRSLEEQERTAVLKQDLAALERIWSESYMVNAPMNVIAPNRAVVLDIFRQGLAHYASFDRKIEEIRFDGDLAIVMGAETVQPIGKAPLAGQTVQRRFTHIWKKEAGDWRLIARHANNVLPSGPA